MTDTDPDTDPATGTGMTVRWLGHATTVLDVAGARLLTDPLLRPHAGLLRRRGSAPDTEAWTGTSAVLVSHLHHDHAELASLRMLGPVPVLSGRANAHWLRGRGLTGATGLGTDEWWTLPGGRVRVRLVRAVHGHRPMPHRPNAAHGFLIAAPGIMVWFAGDTGPFPEMRHLAEVAQAPIDVALVPVGGWGPRLSQGHLDPAEAARVCAAVGARYAVPVHWGTLHAPASRRLPPGWMDRAGPAFVAALARLDSACTPVLLRPGQEAVIPTAAE